MAYAQNRKAGSDYELLDTFDAGIELLGFEVKAVRAGRTTLEGSRVIVRGGEAYLVGATIPPYQARNTPKEYEPERARRLLLQKPEIARISEAEQQKGLTVVPISMHNKGRHIKLSIAIARGKKKMDKREAIKKRDTSRDLKREMKVRAR